MQMKRFYPSIAAIVAIALFGFVAWYFSNIVWYILVSAVLALIGRPSVDLFCRMHVGKWYCPKWLAAFFTLILIWAVVIVGFETFVPVIFHKANELSSFDVMGIMDTFQKPIHDIERVIEDNFAVGGDFSLAEMISHQIKPWLDLKYLNSIISSLPTVLMDTGIALFSVSFITFFFLKEDTLFYNALLVLFPKRYEENANRALTQINSLLIRYFIGLFIESLIKLIVITTGLVLIGFNLSDALIIALISAILNVVPYVGPLVGALIGIFIGVLTPVAGMTVQGMIVDMSILFLGFQILDNIIIQPYVYSSSVKAHPLEIFIVILIAGSLAGILGMLLAIPAYTVLRVFAKEFFNNFRLVQKLTEKM